MRLIALLLLLSACTGVTKPLTYTKVDDPTWPSNPTKWNPPGQNGMVTPPTIPAGVIPGGK